MLEMNLGSVDLNLLVPLEALLDERHVSRAAQRCHLSQPAMSRSLARLRALLDDELLVRSQQGYELTLRAEQLRRDLAALGPQLAALIAGRDFDPASASMAFRVIGTDVTTQLLAPPLTRLLRERSPGSVLTFLSWHPDVDGDLSRGATDLVFRAVQPSAAFRSELLLRQKFVCVVAAGHPLASRTALSMSAYLRQSHVAVDLTDGRQPSVDDRLGAAGRQRSVAAVVPYHSVAIDIVDDTNLVATVPWSFALHLDHERHRVLRAPREIEPVDWTMIWHPRTEQDRAHRWLRSLVREVARDVDPTRRRASS